MVLRQTFILTSRKQSYQVLTWIHGSRSDPELTYHRTYSHNILYRSPIRRYADVVVHRTLLRCLADPKPAAYIPNQQLQELARHINLKHRTAKQVLIEHVYI
jgi:exoribonuclease R